MRNKSIITTIALACSLGAPALSATPASAVSSPHTMRLVKLANGDYTVPMNELLDPEWSGSVTLHAQGLQTLIIVTVNGAQLRQHALELHPGADCASFGAANSIRLNPANTGVPSSTLVALPITNLMSSDYVVAARDATSSTQYKESCAHL